MAEAAKTMTPLPPTTTSGGGGRYIQYKFYSYSGGKEEAFIFSLALPVEWMG